PSKLSVSAQAIDDRLVEIRVASDDPLQQRIGLIESTWFTIAGGETAAGFEDQRRAGANVPLVLRRQAERRVGAAGGDQRQLVGDAAGQIDTHFRLEGFPLATIDLGAARE